MKATTKTILDELTDGLPDNNRPQLIESRGNHIITGALNLLESIEAAYGAEIAEDMQKRLLLSIRNADPKKFSRGVRRLK